MEQLLQWIEYIEDFRQQSKVKHSLKDINKKEKDKIKEKGNYYRTAEKAHGQIEIMEYYQTEERKWLTTKKEWKGLKSIGMEEKTIKKMEKNIGII